MPADWLEFIRVVGPWAALAFGILAAIAWFIAIKFWPWFIDQVKFVQGFIAKLQDDRAKDLLQYRVDISNRDKLLVDALNGLGDKFSATLKEHDDRLITAIKASNSDEALNATLRTLNDSISALTKAAKRP